MENNENKQNSSKDFMLFIADVMPEKMMLSYLKQAVLKHETENSESSRLSVESACMLFLSKSIIKDDGLEKTIKNSNEILSIKERLNSTNL